MPTLSQNAVLAEYLIKNSLDFIGSADAEENIIEYNPAALRAFGYTLEEMVLLDVCELYITNEEYERVVQALDEKGEFSGEVINKRKNGEPFTCYLSANILYNDDGELIGSMGVSRDISYEKELTKKLEVQNEKNAKLIDELVSLSRIATNVSNGVVITTPEGRMKWCNDSFSRITGYSHNELIGHKPSELFRVPHFYIETFNELTKDGPNSDEPIQVPHYHKEGHLYWMLVESTPVYDDEGNLTEIIEVCTEITDQKKAEMALVESEANFRQMSETIEDVFFLYNVLDKQYEYVSPNSQDMLGVDPEFFYAGKAYLNKFVLADDRHIIRRGRLDIMSGNSYDIEYRVSVEGQIRWLRERAFPVRAVDGQIIKGSGVVSDITILKRDQELLDIQNRNIAESITYAKRIQSSTLQSESDIRKIFKDSFLYFLPKGELSGDFYIADYVNSKDDTRQLPVFFIGDCTGHGVPGAILSILCLSLARQTMRSRKIHSPAGALAFIRRRLIKIFHSDQARQINDGMDAGFGIVDEENKRVLYSGANLSVLVLRKGKWLEIEGSKQHVGYVADPSPFKDVSFDYESGDQLYLFTDGFVDQFGGENNKKYLKRRLKQFISSIADEPMKKQRKLIEKEFHSWKGREEQTDDICCFGLKLD
ncbi:MAG: PAS domain S-box protein [Crocinitomicaceae bacterium]|nr:PAS domain S-box protein [Crocinitomicaceae bacterium]